MPLSPGYPALTPTVWVGSAQRAPSTRLVGGKALSGGWPDETPTTFTRTVIATEPNYQTVANPLGSNDVVADYQASDYFQSPNNTLADLAANDFILHMVFEVKLSAANHALMSKRDGATGWVWYVDTTEKLQLQWDSVTTGTTTIGGTKIMAAGYHDAWIFGKQNEASVYGLTFWLDGKIDKQVDNSANADVTILTSPLRIGSGSAGTLTQDGGIALAEVYALGATGVLTTGIEGVAEQHRIVHDFLSRYSYGRAV